MTQDPITNSQSNHLFYKTLDYILLWIPFILLNIWKILFKLSIWIFCGFYYFLYNLTESSRIKCLFNSHVPFWSLSFPKNDYTYQNYLIEFGCLDSYSDSPWIQYTFVILNQIQKIILCMLGSYWQVSIFQLHKRPHI